MLSMAVGQVSRQPRITSTSTWRHSNGRTVRRTLNTHRRLNRKLATSTETQTRCTERVTALVACFRPSHPSWCACCVVWCCLVLRMTEHAGPSSSTLSSSDSSSAPPVDSSSRIFIGNLPFKITDDLLHSTFAHCGPIEGVHWVTDKATGKFYGSAFIDFQSPAAIAAALALNHTELLGRPIKVGLATGRQSAGQNRFNNKQKNGGHLALHPISDKPDGTTTVFLGNLSFDIDESTVTQLFKDCGEVKQVRWVEKDGVFKGCGFVEFHETEATDLAVKLNGREVLGRPMRVDYSGNTSRGE